MQQVHRHATKQTDYIVELDLMLKRGLPTEKIADWMAVNGLRHSSQLVRNTFKYAGREDLIDLFIKEESVKVGDVVRSRMSARIGVVVATYKDDLDVLVHWDAGGNQKVSIASLFKLRNHNTENATDVTKLNTKFDDYGDIKK
jgi:hypothetical protein